MRRLEMNGVNEKWIIMDWAYNWLFPRQEFESFEDGWDWIYENIEDEDNAYADLFVVSKDEYADKLNKGKDYGKTKQN